MIGSARGGSFKYGQGVAKIIFELVSIFIWNGRAYILFLPLICGAAYKPVWL